MLLRSNFIRNLRSFSTVIEPVKLSYSVYESTNEPTPNVAPLIIHHGLFGSKSNWNSLCKAYSQKTNPQRKVIAVDARNHGESPHADHHTYDHLVVDLKHLLNEEFQINRAIVLGHSMGGRAAMHLALNHPEIVERLIVVDISPIKTSPNLMEMPKLFKGLKRMKLPKNVPMSAARQEADKQMFHFCREKSIRNFLLTNLIQKENGSYDWRLNLDVLLSYFDKIASFPDRNKKQYNGPTLFIAGKLSDYLRESDHKEILEIFPKAEFKYIDGAGHWVHAEKPNEFLDVTLEFLNRRIH